MYIKKHLAVAFICIAVLAIGQAFADDADDEGEDIAGDWINNVPSVSNIGLRGLPQTVAAEPLGMGRLNFLVSGAWFKQEQDLEAYFPDSKAGPAKGSNVSVFRVGGSYGVSEEIDLFGSIPMFMVGDTKGNNNIAPGLFVGGGQYTFPFPAEMAFRLAFHAHVIFGLKSDGITYNPLYTADSTNFKAGKPMNYAGYDFADVRENSEISLVLKAPMSLLAGNLRRAVKFHVNPGFALIQNVKSLFLLSGGFEIDPTEYLTVGLEGNWRTPVSEGNGFGDPFWVSPSVAYRSPYYAEGLFGWSFVAGADIRLSKETMYDYKKANGSEGTESIKPLESYRLFGGFVFSFDLLASKRAEMIRQARANAAEKSRLRKLAALTAAQRDSVEQKAREDSLAMADEMAAKAEKARQDSIAAAEGSAEREAQLRAEAESREAQLRAEAERKRGADSLALVEANKRLAEERAKRSEAEQMLLSTGMIVLDAVYFQTGKTEIHANSKPYLSIIAKMLAKYPKLKLEVGGHTDATGNLQANTLLSQKRAEAVFMFMHSVEPSLAQMLSAKGYGPMVPKADNNTAAGREANRRVELKVLNPEVLQEYNP